MKSKNVNETSLITYFNYSNKTLEIIAVVFNWNIKIMPVVYKP